MNAPPSSVDRATLLGSLTDEERALPHNGLGWYEKYEIAFTKLTQDDLELLRGWRNDPEVQRHMIYREQITAEMQADWFRSRPPSELYSLLWFRGERIGYCQLRGKEERSSVGESGIVIVKPEHRGGLIPYRAALAGMDWAFLWAGVDVVHGTVLKSNTSARRFARSLGHRFSDPDPAGPVLRSSVDVESYFRAAAPIRAVLRKDSEQHRAQLQSSR